MFNKITYRGLNIIATVDGEGTMEYIVFRGDDHLVTRYTLAEAKTAVDQHLDV